MTVDNLLEIVELPVLLYLNTFVAGGSSLEDVSATLIGIYTSIKIYNLIKKPAKTIILKALKYIKDIF